MLKKVVQERLAKNIMDFALKDPAHGFAVPREKDCYVDNSNNKTNAKHHEREPSCRDTLSFGQLRTNVVLSSFVNRDCSFLLKHFSLSGAFFRKNLPRRFVVTFWTHAHTFHYVERAKASIPIVQGGG